MFDVETELEIVRVLVLTASLTIPPRDGYSLRCYHLAKELGKRHHVDVIASDIAHTEDPNRWGDAAFASVRAGVSSKGGLILGLRALLSGRPYHVGVYARPALRRALSEVLSSARYDVIYAHFLYFSELLAAIKQPRPLLVLDQHNLDRDMWLQKARGESNTVRRVISRVNLRATKAFEERYYRIYDLIISVSEQDRAGTLALPGVRRVKVIPNGVDVERYKGAHPPSLRRGNVVLFVGSKVEMNIQAVRWFAESVFPLVKKAVPDAEFHVVGMPPPRQIGRVGTLRGVKVWGSVPDVAPHFRSARVFVAPFHMGSGSKLKVLEAFAARCPVVSTEAGVRGVDGAVAGIHYDLANDAIGFAGKCISLLVSPHRADLLAAEAHSLVRERYDWPAIGDRLEGILRELLDRT